MSPRTENHRHAVAVQEEAAMNREGAEGVDSSTVIFPRRKAGQNKRPSTQAPVVVTLEVLQEVFDLPLWKACQTLGICATAMKKVCRKLGVMEWPYKKNHMPGKRIKAASANHHQISYPSDSCSTECEDAIEHSTREEEEKIVSPIVVCPSVAPATPKVQREVRSRTKAARIVEAKTTKLSVAVPAVLPVQETRVEEFETMAVDTSSSSSCASTDEVEVFELSSSEEEELAPFPCYDPTEDGTYASMKSCFSPRATQAPSTAVALGDDEWGDLDSSWLRNPDLMYIDISSSELDCLSG